MDNTSNLLSETQAKATDLERKLKSVDADRQQTQDDLDDTRDALQIEINRSQNVQAQLEKLKLDTDKRITEKEDECDALK